MRAFVSGALTLAFVGMANAQSISSFQVGQLNGITSFRSGNTLSLTLSGTPTLNYNNTTYQVLNIFGMWALDDTNDLSATGLDSGDWKYHDNYAGQGGIAGWKTQNANQGVYAGQSVSLTFASLAGQEEALGYHVRLTSNLPGGGNTLFIRNTAAVPEPASLAALGLGAAALLRRLRKS